MPAKPQWSQIRFEDAVTLAASVSGLPALAGSSWTYDVGVTNWLGSSVGATPGWLNKIRHDLRVVLEDVDTLFGTRGWPEGCVCSGPWVLPQGKLVSVPGTLWVGTQTGAAGAHAQLKEVRCLAWESITKLVARGDVAHNGISAWDGSTYVLDYGWSGTFDGGVGGFVQLTFTCGFSVSANVTGYQDGTDGIVFVEINTDYTVDGGTPQFTATLNGSPCAVIKTTTGFGSKRYAVDVTAAAAGTSLVVAFTWPTDTAAGDWGASFSARHEYSGAAYKEVLAETGYHAQTSPDFRVTGGGDWQIADTWVWPEFSTGDDIGNEQFCIMAKTLPVVTVYHQDFAADPPRLSPAWNAIAIAQGWRIEAPPAILQRSDWGNEDGTADANGRVRDGIENGGDDPSYALPTTPGLEPCYAIPGIWIHRRGLAKTNHEPLLEGIEPDDAGLPTAGPEVTVTLGCWRGGDFDDATLPGVYTGGTFDESSTTYTLGAKASYVYHPFTVPWACLENKAMVWSASPDSVEVSAIVVCGVVLPTGGSGVAQDWDAGWPGDTAAGFDRDSDTLVDTLPDTPDDIADPWIDFPGHGYNETMSVAFWNDTVALIELIPS